MCLLFKYSKQFNVHIYIRNCKVGHLLTINVTDIYRPDIFWSAVGQSLISIYIQGLLILQSINGDFNTTV